MGACGSAFILYVADNAFIPQKINDAGYKKHFQVGLFTALMTAKWFFAYSETTKKEVREFVKSLLPE